MTGVLGNGRERILSCRHDRLGAKEPTFLCLNNDGFDGLRRPRHILMQYIARRGYRALFASDPQRAFTERLRKRQLRLGGITKVEEGLFWYQPPALLPDTRRPILASVFRDTRVHLLRLAVLATLGPEPVILVSAPHMDFLELIGRYQSATVVYLLHDRYLMRSGAWVPGHDQLLARAQLVMCGSESLLGDAAGKTHGSVHLFPPGVDFDIFPRHLPSQDTIRPDARPIIGCVGNFGSQIDWDLIEGVVNTGDYDFQFVGPINRHTAESAAFQRVAKNRSVIITGRIEHSEIPSYIANFDVCIMPYLLNEYTGGVNPIKLFEYFAFGAPVVSTPIPYVRKFADLVYLGSSIDDWISCIRSAVDERDERLRFERWRLASAQGYEQRVELLLQLLAATKRSR